MKKTTIIYIYVYLYKLREHCTELAAEQPYNQKVD